MKRGIEIAIVTLLVVLGFGVRLYKINNPVADWHSWRQADTASVTRNFVKSGVNLFLPRFDDLSDISAHGFNLAGYRLVEFPIFNLLHYGLVKLIPFGTLEMWGRMVSILASLVSAICIYFLVKRYATPNAALVAMAIFLFMPFNIYFSRVILPDPLMVALALTAVVVFPKHKWVGLVLGALAILVKPTAVFILLPIVFAWRFAPLILLGPFLVWRMWQLQHPEGIPGSTWLLNGDHIRFKGAFWRWIFGDRLGRLMLGYWGIWPALEGITNLPKQLWWFLIGSLMYLVIFATGNVRHDYYQIPIIPAVAIVVGIGIVSIWQRSWLRKGLIIVAVTFMLAFGWYEVRGDYQVNNYPIVLAGRAADRLLPQDAIVIADYNGDTAFLYQTNRKGFPNVPLPIEEMVKRLGVSYYISVNYDDQTNNLLSKYQVVEQTSNYAIIDLTHPK